VHNTPQTGAWIQPTGNAPSYAYGYGAVNLDRILRFADSQFSLFVQNEVSLRRNGYVDYCFLVPAQSANDFRATMAWSDPPGDTTADMALINDLVRCCCAEHS
jgi:hypothetical protein